MSRRVHRPLSPAERRERHSKRKYAVATALLVGLLVLTAAGVWFGREWNPVLSEEDFCKPNVAPVEEVVVLLDATDPWNAIQRRVIAKEFRSLQRDIPRYAQVHLYTVDEDSGPLPAPALRMCNPGTADDFRDFPLIGKTGANVVANPELLEQRWKEGFIQQLDSIFNLEGASGGAGRSPLVETIRGFSIEVFGSAESQESGAHRLYIFSDMLQHSELYSHYRDSQWGEAEGKRLADLSVAGSSSLRGIHVTVFLLDRDVVGSMAGHERSALVEFWDSYFAEQGATLMQVRRIEG